MKTVAFIPARSGSKRVIDKNIRPLAGHPLLAYSVHAALESGCFDTVVCATDSDSYAEIAIRYGAEVPALRPNHISSGTSPDIEWVEFMLEALAKRGENFDSMAILRPTSPFRSTLTIRRAFDEFMKQPRADSIRAVEPVSQHPGKMWIVRDDVLLPLLPWQEGGTPWHSCQYHALPRVYVQNASLEIAKVERVKATGTISGTTVMPFFTRGLEGFDINSEQDWSLGEIYLAEGAVQLPDLQLRRLVGPN